MVGVDIWETALPRNQRLGSDVRVQDYAWLETSSIDGQEANRFAASGLLRGGRTPRLANDDSPKRCDTVISG